MKIVYDCSFKIIKFFTLGETYYKIRLFNFRFVICDEKVNPESRVVKVLSGLLRVCVSASVLIRGIARFLSDIGQVKL